MCTGQYEEAFWELNMAATLSDDLVYDEPWGWMQPPLHALGALSLEQVSVRCIVPCVVCCVLWCVVCGVVWYSELPTVERSRRGSNVLSLSPFTSNLLLFDVSSFRAK